MGRGGQPGKPRPRGVYKFTVEFLGGELARPCPSASGPSRSICGPPRHRSRSSMVEAVPDDVPGHWRVHFDLTVDGHEPVDMRLFLRRGDTALSETWLYLFEPPVFA